ncbi:hypothetical protein [Variovorax sp. UC122_21]|uniref:hypothetical protein n=1 Tax=Variovorax sp. UC122_21 TaxID=3374554 RepID=UPI0037565192
MTSPSASIEKIAETSTQSTPRGSPLFTISRAGVAEAEIHVAAVANDRMEYLAKGPVHPVAEEPGTGAHASLHFIGYPERP